MPIEIREVVIKAQLEKSFSEDEKKYNLSDENLDEVKEKIVAEVLEKIMDKLWKIIER